MDIKGTNSKADNGSYSENSLTFTIVIGLCSNRVACKIRNITLVCFNTDRDSMTKGV